MKDQNAVALVRKRWAKYSPEERSAYMKRVRAGEKPSKDRRKPKPSNK